MHDFTEDPLRLDISDVIEKYTQGACYSPPPLTIQAIHTAGLEVLAAGRYGEAELCLRIARERAFRESPDLYARISIDLASCLLERFPRAAFSLLSRLDRSLLPPNYQLRLLANLGTSLGSMCDYSLAYKIYIHILDLAAACHNHVAMALSHANCANILFEHGNYKEADWCNNEAANLLTNHNEPVRLGLVFTNMAINAMHSCNYDSARELFDRANSIGSWIQNVKLTAFIRCNLAELELLYGDFDTAHELLSTGEAAASSASLPTLVIQSSMLKSFMDGNINSSLLIDSPGEFLNELGGREVYREVGAVVALTSAVSDRLGLENSWTRLRSERFAQEQAKTLSEHYTRIIDRVERPKSSITRDELSTFITQSPSIIKLKDNLRKLINTDVRLLIEGESGTGKSFLARRLHEVSDVRLGPWVIVDCTNLEENLFESKLFGHLRGSFTGAVSDTVGLVEQANGGTLFLDEIGELPTEIQGKLLYVIEEQRYRPVGAKHERGSEFRLIAATNRDIDRMLEEGRLRRDLFFRLAGYRVHLPPLRDRREDIVPLAEHRLQQLNSRYGRRKVLRHSVWQAMIKYEWPGNVRELNTTLERGYHLSSGRRIALEDLGLGIGPDDRGLEDLSWYSVRRQHLLRVLRVCKGNVSRAAQLLGLNRTTLIYKLKLLDVSRKDFDPAFDESASKVGAIPSVSSRGQHTDSQGAK
jgi:DNA-binding NtrC family response regulator/tetratricopeptide (TPR) repeat protein